MWKKLLNILTKATPLEKEKDILMDHNYDGIQELDNKLPPWWLWLFYFTIIFSIVYLYRYEVQEWSSDQEYADEVKIAEAELEKYREEHGFVDAASVELIVDEERLAEGQKTWEKDCWVCHLKDGGGSIGPNMTDEYWIHGGEIGDLFKVIEDGVVEKGMQSWKAQLNPERIQNVASYILHKLVGTTPAVAKEPQGEKKMAPEELETGEEVEAENDDTSVE